jgi:hypothetical protein
MSAWLFTVLALLTVLTAAGFTLASHVVARGATPAGALVWFGMLTAMFVAVIGAGVVALLVLAG